MAYADSGYVLNQGRVFVAERLRNGALVSGFDYVGDADQVSISVAQKTDTIKDLFTGRGQVVANPVVDTSCSLSIQALDMRLKNWATATWGDFPGARSSGTVSGETIKLFNDQYVKLSHIGVSSVVVTGAVLGVDYVVDSAAHGILRVLPGSTVATAGAPFQTTVAYSYAANLGKVEALVSGQKFYQIMVAGVNAAQRNQPTLVVIRQVQLLMTKRFDLLAKKHHAFQLEGELIHDGLLPNATTTGDLSNFFSWEKA